MGELLAVVLQAILEALAELLLEAIVEGLLEVGIAALGRAKQRRPGVASSAGWLLLGVVLGGISIAIRPTAVFHTRPIRLAILVAIPVVVGVAMREIGRLRREGGKTPTTLATFSGGAALSFGITLVRYFLR